MKEIKSNPADNTKREQSSLKRIGNFIKEWLFLLVKGIKYLPISLNEQIWATTAAYQLLVMSLAMF